MTYAAVIFPAVGFRSFLLLECPVAQPRLGYDLLFNYRFSSSKVLSVFISFSVSPAYLAFHL